MTIEEVRKELEEWYLKSTGAAVLYEGIPLQDFTKKELIVIMLRTVDEITCVIEFLEKEDTDDRTT